MTNPQDEKGAGQQPQGDLGNELRELGQQIEQALRSALESERAKQLQKDISAGLQEIGTQVQSALKSIQDNPRVQDLVERGEQAVHRAQESKAVNDFQEALARGVAQLNEQLTAFINRTRSDAGGTAATGETTRLDPDEK